jgi:hypothetical protein
LPGVAKWRRLRRPPEVQRQEKQSKGAENPEEEYASTPNNALKLQGRRREIDRDATQELQHHLLQTIIITQL